MINRRQTLAALGRPRRQLRLFAAALGGRLDQDRRCVGFARHRRAKLFPAGRQPCGERRRSGRARHQPARQGFCPCRDDAGLAHRRPCLVRLVAFRQEAVRDHRPSLRQAGAVARPLRAGHRRRLAFERSFDPAGRTRSSAKAITRTSTATRPSPRPTARPRRALPPISRRASCKSCSLRALPPISAWHGRRRTRARRL